MIDRIAHVALVVKDLSKSVEFYTHRLGFRVERKMEFSDREFVILSLGEPAAARIELLRYDDTDMSKTVPAERTLLGLRHFALRVQGVASLYEQLKGDGVEMLPNPPFQQPGGAPIAFGRDPDGVLLEFTEID